MIANFCNYLDFEDRRGGGRFGNQNNRGGGGGFNQRGGGGNMFMRGQGPRGGQSKFS